MKTKRAEALEATSSRAPSASSADVGRAKLGAVATIFASASMCILHAACGDASHLFTGRLYLETRECLGTESSIDVVEGDDPGTCSPTCLVDDGEDAARSIYVTTMCGPYPFGTDPSGTDPACPAALAAFARNDTCLSDGGSTHPTTDGGADANTTTDSGGIETGTDDASSDDAAPSDAASD